MDKNIHHKTVESFGDEWGKFDQNNLSFEEAESIFNMYFSIFPWEILPENPEGFDLGCGSGRWAKIVAPKVSLLNCIDPSSALEVAKKNLNDLNNLSFLKESVDELSLEDNSQDFGYSLGVLHHVPDTQEAISSCVKKLKPGAPFLLYLYYAFDNRSLFFKFIWRITNLLRKFISLLPSPIKNTLTDLIAIFVYFPLARLSLVLESLKVNNNHIPLSFYKNSSFYTMRTDSRDRFGTPLEQRFTKNEIYQMMSSSGLENISFSDGMPFWCAVGTKR